MLAAFGITGHSHDGGGNGHRHHDVGRVFALKPPIDKEEPLDVEHPSPTLNKRGVLRGGVGPLQWELLVPSITNVEAPALVDVQTDAFVRGAHPRGGSWS